KLGSPMAYAGSVGPWPVSPSEAQGIRLLGQALAEGFGLLGLFGVDFILRDGRPWPVEVNPRYTASVEVLELALGRALTDDHRRAFDRGGPGLLAPVRPAGHGIVGKRIVFATVSCRFPDDGAWRAPPDDPFALPDLADVPAPHTEFAAGDPVLTVFAAAPT